MKTTWMRNPDDGLDCAADNPADVSRLRSLGYVESDGSNAGGTPSEPKQAGKREGVEKPAAS